MKQRAMLLERAEVVWKSRSYQRGDGRDKVNTSAQPLGSLTPDVVTRSMAGQRAGQWPKREA